MKNMIIIAVIAFIIVISSVYGIYLNMQAETRKITKYNLEYETYLNKEVLGTDVVSVMNKAINQNEKNDIQKDEKGYYIENNENSIKIYLEMITIEKTYPMEEFYNNGMVNFVQNFNLINFKCTSIEYHQRTGKIKQMMFEELAE